MAWFPNHAAENIRPQLDKVLSGLETQGVMAIAAQGYCLGVFILPVSRLGSTPYQHDTSLIWLSTAKSK